MLTAEHNIDPASSYADLLWSIIVEKDRKKYGTQCETLGPKLANKALRNAQPLNGSVGSFVRLNRSLEASDGRPETPSEVQTSDPPPLWALIIGINDYTYPTGTLGKLKGAVPDANAMEQYLRTNLNVPSDQIVNLRDKEATRKKIIDAFLSLRDNPRIKRSDPILIYYAGHGSEVESKDGNIVQTLVPADYLAGETPPIPDRTVAALINQISKERGNNITVIFDCCHSGSGSRGGDDEDEDQEKETLVRECELSPNDVPGDLDADICDSESRARGMRFAEGFAVKGMNSHVLLAACSAKERALEDKKSLEAHGRFTTALLQLFKEIGPDQMTYADVLTKIPRIDGQNPQCEGYHRDRILFDAKVRPPTRRCYDVKPLGQSKSKCILEAGKAHGVTDGAEFTLYSNKDAALAGDSLGVMVAREPNIKPFKSILDPVGNGAPQPTAPVITIQTKAGVSEDLLIHVPMEDQYMPVFEAVAREMSGKGPDPCRIRLVGKDQAKLEIVSHEGGQLRFNTLDTRATDHGFTHIPYSVDSTVDDLHRVLRAAAHYNFHLNVNHPNNLIMARITIDFFPLIEGYDDNLDPVLSPQEGVNLHRGGRIEYDVDEDAKYGMMIKNNSPWDLYFSCFFFDHADFGIMPLTEVDTQTQYSKDCNLKKDSVVDIGYGDSGIPPIECYVPKDLDVTIGFLKFYFTSEVVDLSHVPQISPFTDARSMMQTPKGKKKNDPVWGTILIPVIQKRKNDLWTTTQASA